LKKPLISLLDADCWHFILGEMRPRIFYRRWEYFEALFSFYGFSEYHEFTTYYKKNIKEAVQECALKASETLSCLPYTNRPISKFGASLHDILSDAVDSYVTEVGVDLSILDDHSLGLKYLADFWKGIRIKN
jgi:hypothetical protein